MYDIIVSNTAAEPRYRTNMISADPHASKDSTVATTEIMFLGTQDPLLLQNPLQKEPSFKHQLLPQTPAPSATAAIPPASASTPPTPTILQSPKDTTRGGDTASADPRFV